MKITPEVVLEAYKKTGMKPVFGSWGNGITCGCALTAVARTVDPHTNLSDVDRIPDWIYKTLDLDHAWADHFITGFDNGWGGDINEAYNLGRECREVLKPDENN
jgi:hypothetical protein